MRTKSRPNHIFGHLILSFNKFKNINILVKQANKMTFITHGFRVSVVSDVRERVRSLGITFAY
jgi:hypothetical protein